MHEIWLIKKVSTRLGCTIVQVTKTSTSNLPVSHSKLHKHYMNINETLTRGSLELVSPHQPSFKSIFVHAIIVHANHNKTFSFWGGVVFALLDEKEDLLFIEFTDLGRNEICARRALGSIQLSLSMRICMCVFHLYRFKISKESPLCSQVF